MAEITPIESIINPGNAVETTEVVNNNPVLTSVFAGNEVRTTHNTVPQVQTIIQDDVSSITNIIYGNWDVVWSVNGQTGDVLLDVIMADFIPHFTYQKNAVISYRTKLYRAIDNITTDEEFDPAQWEELATGSGEKPYTSLERLGSYLYRISFEKMPEYDGGAITPAGCSSLVSDGKLYRNLDWYYDESPTFLVQCKGFMGTAINNAITDTNLEVQELVKLPYRMTDGINDYGIMTSVHVLYNDWDWHGSGTKTVPLATMTYHILTKVKSMETIADDLADIIPNISVNATLEASEYLMQFVITDGTTTYVLTPPTTSNGAYSLVDITENPKLTNFRWVEHETVVRNADYMQQRPTGVERWNEMTTDFSQLRFTKAYEQPTRLSEFIGARHTTKDSTDAELMEIYEIAHGMYLERERDGSLWQTTHSVIYSQKGLEALFVQENWHRNFAPAGKKGDKGDTGPQGPAGADGLTTSVSVNGTTYTQSGGNINLGNNYVQDANYVHTDNNYTTAEKNDVAEIDGIMGKIPAQATASNQLADKNFVNSSVQTATANFRGNWESWAVVPTDANNYPTDYAGSKIPTVNDYLVVRDAEDRSDIDGRFTQLDYIESTGTQYIDSGVYPYRTMAKYKVSTVLGSHDSRFLSCYSTNAPNRYYAIFKDSVDGWKARANYNSPSFGPADTSSHEFVFNDEQNRCYIDGALKSTNSGYDLESPMDVTAGIFANHRNNGEWDYKSPSTKLWYMQIYDKNANGLVRDFVPAKAKTASKNLFNEKGLITEKTLNGITAKFEGGKIVVSGTATANANLWYSFSIPSDWLGETITMSISGDIAGISNVGMKTSGTNVLVLTQTKTSITASVTQEMIDSVNQMAIYCTNGTTANASCNIQIEIANASTSYEPYYEAGEVGLYDTVNDRFYINAGTGEFVAGPPKYQGTWRFKYSGVWGTDGKNGWQPEYMVNETPMTAAQLAALNSNITAELTEKLQNIPTLGALATKNTVATADIDDDSITPAKLHMGKSVDDMVLGNDTVANIYASTRRISYTAHGATNIPENADLNTIEYLKVGKFYIQSNRSAETLINCPTTRAFTMIVHNCVDTRIDDEATATYVYRVREITDLNGDVWRQKATIGSTAGQPTYDSWRKVIYDTNLASVATSGSYNDLSNKPTSMKNPYQLAIQQNGTSLASYDGSAAKTANIVTDTITFSKYGRVRISSYDSTNGDWVKIASAKYSNANNAQPNGLFRIDYMRATKKNLQSAIYYYDVTISRNSTTDAVSGANFKLCRKMSNLTDSSSLYDFENNVKLTYKYTPKGSAAQYSLELEVWVRGRTSYTAFYFIPLVGYTGDYGAQYASNDAASIWTYVDINGKMVDIGSQAYVSSGYTDMTLNANTYNDARTLVGNGRITSANVPHVYDNGQIHSRIDIATSSMTTAKPSSDGFIQTFLWDNNEVYDAQIFYPNSNAGNHRPQFRATNGTAGSWDSWHSLAYQTDIPSMAQILNAMYPVGSIYMSATLDTAAKVQTALGGTWEAWGSGRVPVGVDSEQTEFNTVEKTGGEKTHQLTANEMPSHTHQAQHLGSISGGENGWIGNIGTRSGQDTGSSGGNAAHNNLQPYITCYMWKRTA